MRTFEIEKVKDNIRFLGRVFTDPESGYPWFDWSLTGMEFRYTGRVLTAHFQAEAGREPSGEVIPEGTVFWTVWPRFAVYLDEETEPHRIFTVDKEEKDEIIFSSDKKEDHTIRIVKITEALKTAACVDSFFGDGEILKTGRKKGRKIEFVGDSITCGYGNLGTPGDPGFYSEHQDGTKAYGAVAAAELHMDYQMIGYSGICAGFSKWNRKPYSMLDMYDYTDYVHEKKHGAEHFEPWDFKHNEPDYIVVNLGTNDAEAIFFMDGDHEAYEKQFEEDYYRLLVKIRERNGIYPKIICALGDMNYYLFDNICRACEKFRADTGDTKLYTLKLRGYSAKQHRGAVNHPGTDSSEMMGRQLAAFIRSIN